MRTYCPQLIKNIFISASQQRMKKCRKLLACLAWEWLALTIIIIAYCVSWKFWVRRLDLDCFLTTLHMATLVGNRLSSKIKVQVVYLISDPGEHCCLILPGNYRSQHRTCFRIVVWDGDNCSTFPQTLLWSSTQKDWTLVLIFYF